jgi:hypothetical protein
MCACLCMCASVYPRLSRSWRVYMYVCLCIHVCRWISVPVLCLRSPVRRLLTVLVSACASVHFVRTSALCAFLSVCLSAYLSPCTSLSASLFQCVCVCFCNCLWLSVYLPPSMIVLLGSQSHGTRARVLLFDGSVSLQISFCLCVFLHAFSVCICMSVSASVCVHMHDSLSACVSIGVCARMCQSVCRSLTVCLSGYVCI